MSLRTERPKPFGIRRILDELPIVIRRAITPPHWTTFTESPLCSINPAANFSEGFWIVPGTADCPARCHQLMYEALTLLRLKIWIA